MPSNYPALLIHQRSGLPAVTLFPSAAYPAVTAIPHRYPVQAWGDESMSWVCRCRTSPPNSISHLQASFNDGDHSGDIAPDDFHLAEASPSRPTHLAREGSVPSNSFYPESGDRPERLALAEPMHRRHAGGQLSRRRLQCRLLYTGVASGRAEPAAARIRISRTPSPAPATSPPREGAA